MLIVSSKKDIWENHAYSKKDSFLDFDLDSELALDNTAYAKITKKAFKKRVKGKRILVLIHGYNLDFLDVLASYSMLHQNIVQHWATKKQPYDEVIGYTWHAGDDNFDYFKAKKFAAVASKRLQFLLKDTLKKADNIDVMTHSLGARVLLKALATGDTNLRPKIRNHFCIAAAVSNTCFEKGKHLRQATKQANATWIFHSKNDSSLKFNYLLAKYNTAMGLTGPIGKTKKYPKRTASIDCSDLVFTHGAYKRLPAFYSCLENILNKDMVVREKQFELEPPNTAQQTSNCTSDKSKLKPD